MLVSAVDTVLPGGDTLAALFTNFVLGAVAILLLGLLARQLYGEQVASKAMVLGAMFPGSFVLSFAYTEALLLVFAMGCLWCLLRSDGWRRRAGRDRHGHPAQRAGARRRLRCRAFIAIRSDGTGVARRAAARSSGSSRSSCGSVTTPVRRASGSACRARRGTKAPATASPRSATPSRPSPPLASPTDIITAVSVMAMALMIYFDVAAAALPMVAYVVGVLALMMLPNTVTARPRFLYTAFPAVHLGRVPACTDRTRLGAVRIGACTAGLVTLTALYGVLGAIP